MKSMKKPKLKILFIFFLFLSFNKVYGQKDSLRQIYTDVNLSDSIRFKALREFPRTTLNSTPDSLFKTLEYHYRLAVEKKDSSEIVFSLMMTGRMYDRKEDYKTAECYLDDAMIIAKKIDEKYLEMRILQNTRSHLKSRGRYLEAIRNTYKSLEIAKELQDSSGIMLALQQLGSDYRSIGEYDKALEFFKQVEDGYTKYNLSKYQIASNERRIGKLYLFQKRYEEALPYFENALLICQKIGNLRGVSNNAQALSATYNGLNQLDKAEDFARKAITISKELNIKSDIINSELKLAEVTIKTDIPTTLILLEDLLTRIPNTGKYFKQKKRLYDLLYQAYKLQNKPKQAVQMLELQSVYQDSLNEKANQLSRIRELANQEFELELNEIKQNIDIEKVEIITAQRKKMFVLALLSVIIIIVISLYFRLKIKKSRGYRDSLLEEIEQLKINDFNSSNQTFAPNKFELDIEKIESHIDKQLNETDKNILQTLLIDPVVSNKQIADQVFLSVEGVSSALRRMYIYFNVKESKYKKISLLLEAVKLSNN